MRRGGSDENLPFVDSSFVEALSNRSGRERGSHREKPDHKTMQLCRQAHRALSLALAGECNDDVLRELMVDSVAPAPDPTRLLVRVLIPGALNVALAEILVRLDRATPILRRAVAQAIVRKRAPELSFLPIAFSEEVTP
jgi:ribosome-binding factor A